MENFKRGTVVMENLVDMSDEERFEYRRNNYDSSSLNLVAWLLTRGHKIQKKTMYGEGHLLFTFTRNQKLDADVQEYLANEEMKRFMGISIVLRKKVASERWSTLTTEDYVF